MAVGKLPRRGRASCRLPGTNAAPGFRGTPEGSVRPDASSRPAGGEQLHSGKCAGRVLCVSTKGPEWSYFSPSKDSKSSGIVPRNPVTQRNTILKSNCGILRPVIADPTTLYSKHQVKRADWGRARTKPMTHTPFVYLTVLAYLASMGLYLRFLYKGKELTG